jgi:hypothetical protein
MLRIGVAPPEKTRRGTFEEKIEKERERTNGDKGYLRKIK